MGSIELNGTPALEDLGSVYPCQSTSVSLLEKREKKILSDSDANAQQTTLKYLLLKKQQNVPPLLISYCS